MNFKTSESGIFKTLFLITIFLFFHSIKIILFYNILINDSNIITFAYKFVYSTLWWILFIFLLSRIHKSIFIGIYLIELALICGNILYYLYYRSYFHLSLLFQLFREGIKGSIALPTIKWYLGFIAFLDLPIFIILLKYWDNIKKLFKIKVLNYILIIIVFLGIFSIETINYIKKQSLIHIIKPKLYSNVEDSFYGEWAVVKRYGIFINMLLDYFVFSSENNVINNLEKNKFYYYKNNIDKRKEDYKSIILIQVESLGSEIVNIKYKNKYIMPYLNSLITQSIYYPYLLSTHGGGSTSDAEFEAINGLPAPMNIAMFKTRNYDYPNSVVKKLIKYGYKCYAFHNNYGYFFNREIAFNKMGYNKFYDIKSMKLKEMGWGAPDHEVFNYVLNNIKKIKKPFFIHIITMSSHGPFDLVNNYYTNSEYSEITNKIVRNYFNSMNYVDKELKKFIDNIRLIVPDTTIIIFGDHSPGDLEFGNYNSSRLVYNNMSFETVPLLILKDNIKYIEKNKIPTLCSIAPTILELSGIPYEYYSSCFMLLPGYKETNLSNNYFVIYRKVMYEQNELKNILLKD